MRSCKKCDIELTGDLERCPLCQAELTGESVPSAFPPDKTKKSGSVALKIMAFATGVCLVVMIFLWQVIPLSGNIVLTVCLALIVNFLFVQNILTHNPNFLRVVVRYFLVLLVLAAVWFLLTWNLIITTYFIPGICLVALIFDTVLLAIFRGTFVAGYAKYLLFNIVLGLLPLVLTFIGLTTWNIPAYISALTASIFFLGLVIFMHRQLLDELRKLFST